MTVAQFKQTKQYKHAKDVYYLNINGEEIVVPDIVLDNLYIIGCANNADGTIVLDLYCY